MGVDYMWSLKELEESRKLFWEQLFPVFREQLPEGFFYSDKTRKVVDVGCGSGYIGRLLVKEMPCDSVEVAGVDREMKILVGAKAIAKEENLSRYIEFCRGYAYNIPFMEDSVDLVLFVTLLINIEEPERAIKEAIRITKQGGYVVAIESDFTHDKAIFPDNKELSKLHWELGEALSKAWRDRGGSPEVAPELPSMFESLGLRNVKSIEYQFKYSILETDEIKKELELLSLKKDSDLYVAGGMPEEDVNRYYEERLRLYKNLLLMSLSQRRKHAPRFAVPIFVVRGEK